MYDYREHVLRFDVEETGPGRCGYNAHAMGCVFVDLKWKDKKGVI